MNQRGVIDYDPTLIRFGNDILNIVALFVFGHRKYALFFGNQGKLQLPLTRPFTPSTPLCHAYSEPPGHEDSLGGTQNVPYLFKNLSKLRLSDPFFGLFLVISEVGSQIYIANLAIFKI